MKILVMMCLASAIASVTQSDPQPKGKPELKFKINFLTWENFCIRGSKFRCFRIAKP